MPTPADAAALLAEYGLPEHAPQAQLRAITRVAATLCGVPTAVVNLLGECVQHQVGAFGFEGSDSALSTSMCARALAEPALRYLPDATREPGFTDNPWVDGRLARVRLYASVPLELEDGRVLGSLCVFSEEPGELGRAQRDGLVDLAHQVVALFEHSRLTRQAQAMAEELRTSEERYRLVAEGSSDVVSVHDLDGRTLWISPSVRRVLGYEPEDEIGRIAVDRADPDDRGRLGDALGRALRGEPAQVLMRTRTAGGEHRWLDTTLTPITGEDGSVRQVHSVARDATVRVNAERARAESDRRYRGLVESSPEGIVVHVEGLVVFANPAAARLLGAPSPGALHGLPMTRFLQPEQIGAWHERAAAVLAGGSAPPERMVVRRLDGGAATVEFSGVRVEIEGRVGVQCVIRDVTEQEAAREALRLSEEQHRLLFDAAPVGMVEADAEGRILRANPALARLLGIADPAEMVGRFAGFFTHPSERAAQAAAIARAARGDYDRWEADRVAVRADGTAFDAAVSCTVVRGSGGGVHRFLAGVVDMSERAAARRALETANAALERARRDAEAREALVSAVLETIDVGVVACDAQGRLTLFNRAARELHGRAADGTSITAGTHHLFQEDGTTPLPDDEVPLARALQEGEVQAAVMVVAPPGRPARTLQVDGRRLRDAHGRVLGAVVAQKDITEQRAHARQLTAARDAALAATRAKSAFLASVSHEIRTPLHGVLGMLELLLLNDLDDAQRERARIAHAAGRTLLALLNDVLDLSKGEALQLRLRPRPVDPARLVREVADSVRGNAQMKGLSLDVVVDGAVPPAVLADPDRVRQVLLNLIGNAVKFTDAGGVRISLDAVPEGLRFAVADTGPGIAPDERERLFAPFEQGAAGAEKGGTGLGLALVQQIVELVGGSIDVESPGGGSRFTVVLPLPATDGPTEPTEVAAPADGPSADRGDGLPGAALNILLVDDNEVNRLVSGAMLRRLGATVTVAESGPAALALAARNRFDLVLMDRQMPGMDGVETTRELRRRPESRGLPIVALTGAGESERQECLDAGMDGFLMKPVDSAALADLLHHLPTPRPPAD